jgi:beta-lactamase regulating signal transducer with metallopeptidase domain/protocatechuate 3,4-dioxygenase beta subunit
MIATVPGGLHSPIIERIGWTLLHFLWQGAVIAIFFGVLLLVLQRHSANTRYLAGCLAMLLMALVPFATYFLIGRPHIPAISPPQTVTTTAHLLMNVGTSVAPDKQLQAAPLPRHGIITPLSPGVLPTLGARLKALLPVFVACWLAGVSLLSIRLCGGWLKTQQLRRSGAPLLDASWTERLNGIARWLEISRPVRLLQSALIEAPMVIGWLRPVVLLPVSALSGLSPQQLEAILAHELAHIRRHDFVVNLLQTLVETLLFYHPAVWWISRRIRQERENCCDDLAVAVCGDRIAYARALTTLEELRAAPSGLAMAARGGSLLSRVRRLVGLPDSDVNRSTWWPAGMLLVSLMAIAIVSTCIGKSNDATTVVEPHSLPDVTTTNMLVIHVVDSAGKPFPVKQVERVRIYASESLWTDLIPSWRLTNESILIKRSSIIQSKPGQKMRLLFLDEHASPQRASGISPANTDQPIILTIESAPKEPDIDETNGPTDVRPDEIAGRVVDLQGKSVEGATATLGNCHTCQPVVTDTQGVFRFPGMDKVWHTYLQVEQPGFATRWVADPPIGRGFTIRLDDTTRVKGRFILPDGKPASKTSIVLFRSKQSHRADIGYEIRDLRLARQTDDQGRYDFPLEPGVYEVQVASESGFVVHQTGFRITAGVTTNLPSQLEPGVRLRMQVVDNQTGEPVAGMKFFIWDMLSPARFGLKAGTERVTDEHGVAEWEGLMPGHTEFEPSKGSYRRFWATNDLDHLRGFWSRSEHPKGGECIGPLTLDLKPGMSPVIVQAERGLRVFGKVVGADGQSVGKAQVDVNVPHQGTLHGDARFRIIADDMGQYDGWFPAGNGTIYDLSAHDLQGRWANGASRIFDSKPGDELQFTFQLGKGGWVVGRILDRDGKALPNMDIEVVADDQLDNPYFNPEAKTDAEGRFKLGPMRPGSYAVTNHLFKMVTPTGAKGPERVQFSIIEGQTVDAGDLQYLREPTKIP